MGISTRFIIVRGKDENQALAEASVKLGVPRNDLQTEQFGPNQYKISVLRGPAEFVVHISPDRFRCVLRRIIKPIGEGYVLSLEECISQLRKRGVIYGINKANIEKVVGQALDTPEFQMAIDVNEIIAEGKPPIDGEPTKVKSYFDVAAAEATAGTRQVCVRGELLAEVIPARPGVEGVDISGNKIPFHVIDSAGLDLGDHVEEKITPEGVRQIVAKTYGMIQKRGRKISVVPQTLVEIDGSQATIDIYPQTFTDRSITYEDLLDALKSEGVSHGFVPKERILPLLQRSAIGNQVIENAVLAEWTEARHGTKQKIFYLYRQYQAENPIDRARAEAEVVIPGQVIVSLRYPEGKMDGMSIFGKRIKARDGETYELFPGKHVKKQGRGDEIVFVSDIYGRVVFDEDRVYIENIVKVSADHMLATIDIYPMEGLKPSDIIYAAKEAEVLDGIVESEINNAFAQALREKRPAIGAVIARGTSVRAGISAKLRFYFDRMIFTDRDFLRGRKRAPICRQGELLLEKIPLKHAEEGKTVYREKITVPPEKEAKDFPITVGEYIERKNEDGLQRYYSAMYGYVSWKDGLLKVIPPITISDDESVASMDIFAWSDLGRPITHDAILSALTDFGIRTGILEAEIASGLKLPEPTLGMVVARALPAEKGADARFRFYFKINGQDPKDWIDGRRDIEPRQALDLFLDGEIIAKKSSAEPGKDGKTVLGRKISSQRGRDMAVQKGDNVDQGEDPQHFVVLCRGGGYPDFRGGKLVVNPLFKIAQDHMQAQADLYPSNDQNRILTKSKLAKAIELAGIRHGTKEFEIHHAIQQLTTENRPILGLVVAEGTQPQNGRDGTVNIVLDMNDKAGLEKEDKRIDYRERNVFRTVKKLQLLALKQPPSRAVPGTNILGEKVLGKDGKEATLIIGSGVIPSPDGREFRASRDGIVEYKEGKLSVIDGCLVEGDVGFETGNIRAQDTPVFIAGNVKPDFEVISTGNISVGMVAEACRIESKGKVDIQGGIVGRGKGIVITEGGLDTTYINQARIESYGNVVIKSECLHSQIYTRRKVVCKKDVGTIVGGEIWAFDGMEVNNLGTPGSEHPTVVNLGHDFFTNREILRRIEAEGLDRQIAQIQDDIKLLTNEMRIMLEGGQREQLQEQTEYRDKHFQKTELQRTLDDLIAYRKSLLDRIPVNPNATVEVYNTVYTRTRFVYGETIMETKELLKNVAIYFNSAKQNLYVRRL